MAFDVCRHHPIARTEESQKLNQGGFDRLRQHIIAGTGIGLRVKAAEEAYPDVPGIVTSNMGADDEGWLLRQRDVLHIGAALVNVARCVDQEVITNVSPAVALLMQALYAFYLDFSLVNI
jgi:hypothetical protein